MHKQKSTTSRVVGIILDILLAVMVLYIGGTLYVRHTTGNPQASLLGFTTHVVISGSMEPAISKGDIVIVKKSDTYKIGDIVTYIREDGFSITHRIIALELDGYTVQGDANIQPDPDIIHPEQIVGKVMITIPVGG